MLSHAKCGRIAQVHHLPSFLEKSLVLSANYFMSPLATLWLFIRVVHECNIDQVLWAYNCVCAVDVTVEYFVCRIYKRRISLQALNFLPEQRDLDLFHIVSLCALKEEPPF